MDWMLFHSSHTKKYTKYLEFFHSTYSIHIFLEYKYLIQFLKVTKKKFKKIILNISRKCNISWFEHKDLPLKFLFGRLDVLIVSQIFGFSFKLRHSSQRPCVTDPPGPFSCLHSFPAIAKRVNNPPRRITRSIAVLINKIIILWTMFQLHATGALNDDPCLNYFTAMRLLQFNLFFSSF